MNGIKFEEHMEHRQSTAQAIDIPHTKKDTVVRDIFSMVAPYIDPLDTAFSLGLCHLWRRKVVSSIKRGENVLDICTGTGELAVLIMQRIGPEGALTCLDFSEEMIEIAERKLSPRPENLTFVLSDVREMKFPDNAFDAVTVAFGMRNVPETVVALKQIWRVLKPGGKFLCLELTRPKRRWFLPIYNCYTSKLMPSIAKMITKTALPYTYLPKSIEAFYPPEEFKRVMRACGFSNVKAQSMSMGIATIYDAVKSK